MFSPTSHCGLGKSPRVRLASYFVEVRVAIFHIASVTSHACLFFYAGHKEPEVHILKRERKKAADSRRIPITLGELSSLAVAGGVAKPPPFGVLNFSPNVRSAPWVGVLCSLELPWPVGETPAPTTFLQGNWDYSCTGSLVMCMDPGRLSLKGGQVDIREPVY